MLPVCRKALSCAAFITDAVRMSFWYCQRSHSKAWQRRRRSWRHGPSSAAGASSGSPRARLLPQLTEEHWQLGEGAKEAVQHAAEAVVGAGSSELGGGGAESQAVPLWLSRNSLWSAAGGRCWPSGGLGACQHGACSSLLILHMYRSSAIVPQRCSSRMQAPKPAAKHTCPPFPSPSRSPPLAANAST